MLTPLVARLGTNVCFAPGVYVLLTVLSTEFTPPVPPLDGTAHGIHCDPSQVSTCPIAGAVADSDRFCSLLTVELVSVPLTSPPAAGNCALPTVPEIWAKE
jgi:hypothetical protein